MSISDLPLTEAIYIVVFDTIKAILALGIGGIVSWKLSFHFDKFTPLERWGMGFQGGGCIMWIGPVISKPSPFDDWAMCLMLLGTLVYYIGRITRHAYGNWAQKREAHKRYWSK